MKVWVYSVMPIDFWVGWHRPENIFRVFADPISSIDSEFLDAEEWFDVWETAKSLAKKMYWEGDIRSGPYVIPIPVDNSGESAFAIAWKQDNNGQTFVASTCALPHLIDEGQKNWRVGESSR